MSVSMQMSSENVCFVFIFNHKYDDIKEKFSLYLIVIPGLHFIQGDAVTLTGFKDV